MTVISWLPLMLLLVLNHMQFSTAVFAESPSQIISLPLVPNLNAVFRCRHMSQDASIIWRVNGSSLSRFPEITDDSVSENDVRVDTLIVPATPMFSETEVVCVATFFGGLQPSTEMTDPVKLIIVTDKVKEVTNLVLNESTLSWDAPSSPDLTGVDPDIVYCVEVYNITCGRRDLIVGDCNVTESSYTSDEIGPGGYIYEYTVTPRSNVEGARNGTTETVEDKVIQLIESAVGQNLVFQMRDNLVIATILLDTVIESGKRAPVMPVSFSTILMSLDGLSNSEGFRSTKTESSEGSITLVISSLPFRRVWKATVLAYGCAQHSLVDNGIEIGTHDIYNISVVSLSGIVSVSGNIIGGSLSSGMLIIAYSLTDETNILYNISTFLPDQLRVNTMLMGLPSDQYQVSVFVTEESGLPFSRAAATPKTVQVDGQGQLASPMIGYRITMSDSSSVCIICNFLDNSTTHCLVVVHRRISQLTSSGLMSIMSSHKFNRSGDTAFGCIEGVKLEQYQVGVIGGMLVGQEKDGLHPGVTAVLIMLAILVLVGLILIVSLILAYAVVRRRKDRQDVPKTIPANRYTTVHSVSKQKTSKEEEAMLESGDELGVQSASVQQVSQKGSQADPVYTCTKQVGPRSRMLQNKELEAEAELGGEYETLPKERIQPTSENRDACEYDVVQLNRSEHTQEDQHVNEYDVVAREEIEHTKGKDKSSKQDKYAEVGATSSPRLMVKLDDDKVIYSDVQSPEVEQESQEGADNAVTVVRSSADSESSAGHEVESAIVVMSEAVSAFSSNQSSTDVSELVTLIEGGNDVSNEIFGEVRVSQCDPKAWQNKDLVLPRYNKATHQFLHLRQTMQLHHRRLCRHTGQE